MYHCSICKRCCSILEVAYMWHIMNVLMICTESSVKLFNEAVKLICKRLKESWKNDLSCGLATLEVLSALAQVRLVEQSQAECKRAIYLICDFVISQCSRPAPSHSKVGIVTFFLGRNKASVIDVRIKHCLSFACLSSFTVQCRW